jgi:peptidoglycan/LPS O-acetylase OafA/YrhL
MTETPNFRGFLPRVESLRGIAAVLVGGYHIGQILLPDFPEGAARIFMGICNGIGCVVAFFVISGFVLSRSLDRKIRASDGWASQYFAARVFRLYPAAVGAVALFVLFGQFGFPAYSASSDPLNVLLNMTMIRTDIDRVMWSMKVELVATPLIPLAVIAFYRWGWRSLIIAITALFGFSFFGQYCEALGQGSNLGPIYAFISGALLHFCGPTVASLIKPSVAPLVAAFSDLVFVVCGALKPTAIQVMVECMSASTLILVVVWHPASLIFRPLDWPVVRFYGRISYSFYLLNPLTFFVIRRGSDVIDGAINAGVPLVIATSCAALFSALLTTPIAYLSWRFIEMPGVALGRAIFHRRFKAPA